jgi:hypothetical protein
MRYILFPVATIFMVLIGLLAFEEPVTKLPAAKEVIASEDDESPIFNLYWSPTDDTITSAENDTLLYGTRLDGTFAFNHVIRFVNLSGTTAANIILQETNAFDTDDATSLWYPVDTTAVSGAGVYRVFGSLVYGRHQRLIIDGSGVQSSTYDANSVFKRN